MQPTHQPIRVDRFEQFLVKRNLSRTKPRRLLYKTLATSGALSAPALVATLDGQVDRATVYRTIDFFVANRIAVRMAGGAIELGEYFRPHHHHLTCDNCRQTINIDDEPLERVLADIATRHQFVLAAHQVELVGLCEQCRAAV